VAQIKKKVEQGNSGICILLPGKKAKGAALDTGQKTKRGDSYILFVKRKKQEKIKSLKTMS
jgi:hypothetical protein